MASCRGVPPRQSRTRRTCERSLHSRQDGEPHHNCRQSSLGGTCQRTFITQDGEPITDAARKAALCNMKELWQSLEADSRQPLQRATSFAESATLDGRYSIFRKALFCEPAQMHFLCAAFTQSTGRNTSMAMPVTHGKSWWRNTSSIVSTILAT